MSDFLKELNLDPENLRWHDLASCQRLPFNLFFDSYESNKTIAEQVDKICLNCPVQKECYEEGTSNQEIGVWGGFYLIKGQPDKVKNSHKSLETVQSMMKKVL